MNYISWKDDRKKYIGESVQVIEVPSELHHSKQYKVVGIVKHKWWFTYTEKILDNPYNEDDNELYFISENAIRYAKKWLSYFENPNQYDEEKRNIIFDKEVITPETHPEYFI